MTTTIWHNPRCSKSRQTLELLRAQGVEPAVILYLETPPTAEDIEKAAAMMGRPVRDLLRTKEAAYAEYGLADATLNGRRLAEAMAKSPILIERPVVLHAGKAAIGRPPEAVMALFRQG